LVIISVSIPKQLLDLMDSLASALGYTGRSELIRDAVREFISSKAPSTRIKERILWVIISVTDHKNSPSVDEKFINIIHSFEPLIRSFYHQMIGDGICLNIAVLDATWTEIQTMLKALRKVRGVRKVWYQPIAE
jgi:CopG family nickel-responsive transcriptional regulator